MSVIIGIDRHKATRTAVAIDRDEQPIATLQGWVYDSALMGSRGRLPNRHL